MITGTHASLFSVQVQKFWHWLNVVTNAQIRWKFHIPL